MPRQSSASRSFAVRSSAEPLRPQPGLTTVEKQIFIDLVANNKPEHFRPSDLPLLVAYTHACALEAALARQITANLRGSDSAVIGPLGAGVQGHDSTQYAAAAVAAVAHADPYCCAAQLEWPSAARELFRDDAIAER